MIISHRERREALEAGMRSLGARIAVTTETDRTVTVFVEPELGLPQIHSYQTWDEAIATWEGKLADARERRRAIRFVDGLFDPARNAAAARRAGDAAKRRIEELSR